MKNKRNFLQNCDLLAEPVTMTYDGQKSHPTNLGGFLTLLISFGLFVNLVDRTGVLFEMKRDTFSQRKIYLEPRNHYLNLTRELLNFQIYFMNGGEQDNFDFNEFYSFKLHRYTNIPGKDFNIDPLEQSLDIEIPMVPCNKSTEYDGGWVANATMFCPNYTESDILFGSYYTQRYSWLRLAVHRCDPREKITVNGR